MKLDVVNRWTRKMGREGTNKTSCAKILTETCGGSTRVQEIWRCENAKRAPSHCKMKVMLSSTLDETLREFGYKRDKPLSRGRWAKLVDALLPPEKK